MVHILVFLSLISCLSWAGEDTNSTIIKYELETQNRDGSWRVSQPLVNQFEGHEEKLEQIVRSRKNGASCLEAAKEFGLMNQKYFARESYRVYVTYKQHDYLNKDPRTDERMSDKRIVVEILEMKSAFADPTHVDNSTSIFVGDEDSQRSMAGCKRKIEAAFKAASIKLKSGKTRSTDSLELKVVKKK